MKIISSIFNNVINFAKKIVNPIIEFILKKIVEIVVSHLPREIY